MCIVSTALARYIEGLQKHYDSHKARLLERYDVVGRVVLVSLSCGAAYKPSDAATPLKDLLSQQPPEDVMTLSKLPAYHDMWGYLQVARQLSNSDRR